MTETGVVRKVVDDRIFVGCKRNEGCSNCSSAFCAGDETMFEARNTTETDVELGDEVTIYLATRKTIGAGFYVLVLPLLLFAAGFLIMQQAYPESGEGLRALVGIIGLFVGFGFSYLRSKKRPSLPEIVSITKPSPAIDEQSLSG